MPNAFLAARDLLLRHRRDLDAACREFRWPVLDRFNRALDHFDHLAAGNHADAPRFINPDDETGITFAAQSARSNQVANHLREAVAAGEPLNPEVIARVQSAWGVAIRDGYGQTETTLLVANTPGQHVQPGSMGRPLPGYRVALVNPDGADAEEGEITLRLDPAPLGLMQGYLQANGALQPPDSATYTAPATWRCATPTAR